MCGCMRIPGATRVRRYLSPACDVPDDNGIRLNHMAVSLYIEGSTWYTVEGGQGGRRLGYDVIKRKIRPWPQPYLRGWVSMRALIAETQPSPIGWVLVGGRRRTLRYILVLLRCRRKSQLLLFKTRLISVSPLAADLKGVMTLKGMYECDVVWQSQDGKESLKLSVQRQANVTIRWKAETSRYEAQSEKANDEGSIRLIGTVAFPPACMEQHSNRRRRLAPSAHFNNNSLASCWPAAGLPYSLAVTRANAVRCCQRAVTRVAWKSSQTV